ncbi:MAG: DUF4386 domain-containing protein [Cytophagales bacterium]|jgi:hypothetical protein|nr:DUF4386 domain-containing protein [Cytophagales bacterium]MCA6499020.1 DUF4386 domain-containing protein [Chitinophagaceae bacterium]MCA6388148.1 DUF4386 domain-containing protein [Cytophagales bacterium]MCA6392708.1 DUF4386 domain-containing protein [Cytophagales bacterium]MCA6396738.1 DUF4386 domain-containing protein [Cytophagales bacterium]
MNDQQKELVRTARITGVWYLALAISGVVGFLLLHPQIYVSDDLPQTVANLTEHETIARLRLLFEFAIVISQALAAVYFFKLFKDINHFASWALAAWGTMNAGVIMISAIAMGGAINVANTTLVVSDKLILIQIFVQIIKNAWGVGSLFFGLWLIPMGYIVMSSQRMPVWLGRTLIIGGAGYIASAFLSYAGLRFSWIDLLTVPATVGEFWIICYLFIFGIRPQQSPVTFPLE